MKEQIRIRKRKRRKRKVEKAKNIRNNNTPNQLKWREDVDPDTGNLKFGESTADMPKEDSPEDSKKDNSGNFEFG